MTNRPTDEIVAELRALVNTGTKLTDEAADRLAKLDAENRALRRAARP